MWRVQTDEVIMLYMAVVSTAGSGILSASIPSEHWRAPTSGAQWALLLLGVGEWGAFMGSGFWGFYKSV